MFLRSAFENNGALFLRWFPHHIIEFVGKTYIKFVTKIQGTAIRLSFPCLPFPFEGSLTFSQYYFGVDSAKRHRRLLGNLGENKHMIAAEAACPATIFIYTQLSIGYRPYVRAVTSLV